MADKSNDTNYRKNLSYDEAIELLVKEFDIQGYYEPPFTQNTTRTTTGKMNENLISSNQTTISSITTPALINTAFIDENNATEQPQNLLSLFPQQHSQTDMTTSAIMYRFLDTITEEEEEEEGEEKSEITDLELFYTPEKMMPSDNTIPETSIIKSNEQDYNTLSKEME